jgi:RNA polymerase primary sigma factor
MDALHRYLGELSAIKYEPIPKQTELELARRIQSGDAHAVRLLVCANLRFVVGIARLSRSTGLPLEDLIAVGNEALVRTAMEFSEKEGSRFTSFAVWNIRKSMLIEAADHSRAIRLPRWVANGLLAQLHCLLFDHPLPAGITNHELQKLSRRTGAPEEIIARTFEADAFPLKRVDLDELAEECPDLEDLERKSLNAAVGRALCRIKNPEEREIIRRYFGLGEGVPLGVREISCGMNLKREQVRKTIAHGVAILRKSWGLRALHKTECN